MSVLNNDSDPDGEVLFIISATAQNGTVVINSDSTLTYTPNKGFAGTDIIRYAINDEDGALAEAQLVITVAPAEVRIDNTGGGGGGTFAWMLRMGTSFKYREKWVISPKTSFEVTVRRG